MDMNILNNTTCNMYEIVLKCKLYVSLIRMPFNAPNIHTHHQNFTRWCVSWKYLCFAICLYAAICQLLIHYFSLCDCHVHNLTYLHQIAELSLL